MGPQRVRHNWSDWAHTHDIYHDVHARLSYIYIHIYIQDYLWKDFLNKWMTVTHTLVAQRVKHLPAVRETQVQSLGWEDPLEKEMATHSSTLAWKIPQTEEPGRLQPMGSQRVGHDWATSLSTHTRIARIVSILILGIVTMSFHSF